MGNVLLIKALVGQVELFPESLAIKRGFAVGGKDPVGGLQNGGKVVDKGAGPIEDEIADHAL